MKNQRRFRVDELAERLNGRLIGDPGVELTGFASLADAGPQELSFYAGANVTGTSYAKDLAQTKAGALLIAEYFPQLHIPQIIVSDPLLAANDLLDVFYPPKEPEPSEPPIHPSAWVAPSARVGRQVHIMPFASVGADTVIGDRTRIHAGARIGDNVQIGEDCLIWPNVVIREGTRLGSRVIIHPGAVIGADGFGYARRKGKFIKLRHVGIVVIEDDVEIGANTTIDRGTLGKTILHRGVKLDNLVHIAHNVEVGEDTVMAAQCGISGSTVIGKRVLMGGQTGLVDHLRVGDEAVFIAQSGVIGDVPARATVSGYPARPHREVLRAHAEMRQLGRLRRRLQELEVKLSRLIGSQ